jgi:hypothetical protein
MASKKIDITDSLKSHLNLSRIKFLDVEPSLKKLDGFTIKEWTLNEFADDTRSLFDNLSQREIDKKLKRVCGEIAIRFMFMDFQIISLSTILTTDRQKFVLKIAYIEEKKSNDEIIYF